MKPRKGFTLVELIVVLVILAVLAAIAAPSLTGTIDRSDKQVCEINARLLLSRYQTLKALKKGGADSVTLSAVISSEGLFCPSGGVYTALPGDAGIRCSIHGDLLLDEIPEDTDTSDTETEPTETTETETETETTETETSTSTETETSTTTETTGTPEEPYPGAAVLGPIQVGQWADLLASIRESPQYGRNLPQGSVYTDGDVTYLFTWPWQYVSEDQAQNEISLEDYAEANGQLTQILDSAQVLTADDIEGNYWKNGGGNFVVTKGAVLTLDSGIYVFAGPDATWVPSNPSWDGRWIKLIDTE